MKLHLIKLSVGPGSLDELRTCQAGLATTGKPLRHLTRQMPRRAAEIVDGGSIFWVIAGLLTARQRVIAIEPSRREDGTACAALILHPDLVAVRVRTMRPFQGWRYFQPGDAPDDVRPGEVDDRLPEHLRRDLAALALI